MYGVHMRTLTAKALAAVAIYWTLGLGPVSAQTWQPLSYLEPGTTVQVRTTQPIDTSTVDGRVFYGTVEQDVRDTSGAIAIPRGARAELVARRGANNELYLDLDSINVNGQRYGIRGDAAGSRLAIVPLTSEGRIRLRLGGLAKDAALLKVEVMLTGEDGSAFAVSAAVGAAAGAAVGAGTQVLTHGRRVSIPAESLITYRLQNGLDLGVKDTGYDRSGVHYHHYRGEPGYDGY